MILFKVYFLNLSGDPDAGLGIRSLVFHAYHLFKKSEQSNSFLMPFFKEREERCRVNRSSSLFKIAQHFLFFFDSPPEPIGFLLYYTVFQCDLTPLRPHCGHVG